jgi:hypothetical protein
MRNLSKSKLVAFRQCPKRLWLEVHKPELVEESAQTQANYRVGNEVGEVARRLFDQNGTGTLIDAQIEGHAAALERSLSLIGSARPLFEAGFAAAGAIAYADVMLPVRKTGQHMWRMIEVKSSTSVKDYHHDDVAIQAFVARSAGVPLASISIAHIDSNWVYPGKGNYAVLLKENDLSQEAFSRHDEVERWVEDAQAIVAKSKEPDRSVGGHCSEPFECGFLKYCRGAEPQAEVAWLPNVRTKALKNHIEQETPTELSQVPDELLNEQQMRVKTHTLAGKAYFDAAGAAADLAPYKLPATFLDFETITFAVPIWKGTRPYQQIPFQFSAHRIARIGKLEHKSFLDLSGQDPSEGFAEALVDACGRMGPVFVYNAGFETARIKELALRFPRLRQALLAINERIVDLLTVARKRYYHPSQEGSWSIKKVLPAIAPDLRYDALEGIQDGGLAMEGFREAIAPTVTLERKTQIERQLLEYCRLDTYGMVRMWSFFSGHAVPEEASVA